MKARYVWERRVLGDGRVSYWLLVHDADSGELRPLGWRCVVQLDQCPGDRKWGLVGPTGCYVRYLAKRSIQTLNYQMIQAESNASEG